MQLKAREKLGKEIVHGIYEERMLMTFLDTGKWFRLASGMMSPYYLNMRNIPSIPALYGKVAQAQGVLLEDLGVRADGRQRVVGLAMAGIPFADASSLVHGIPALYTRKLPETVKTPEDVQRYLRDHGSHQLVEGDMSSGDRLVIVDDLVTRFDSKLLGKAQVDQEIERRELVDVTTVDFTVLLDREQGAAETARRLGFNLNAFIPFATKGMHWLEEVMPPKMHQLILAYAQDPSKYQDPELQSQLMASIRAD